MARSSSLAGWLILIAAMRFAWCDIGRAQEVGGPTKALLDRIGASAGVCVFLGLPDEGGAGAVVKLAQASELLIYVESHSADEVAAMRKAAADAKLLGKRIWVDERSGEQIQMASNMADAIFISRESAGFFKNEPAIYDDTKRVLHPRAKAYVANNVISKPLPEGLEAWSHPYHGPDNNTQSTDQVARYPYLTQFLGEPMFGCISEVTVASGGRIFKAFGHIAFKEISNEVLNKLYAINAYNGQILWTRPIKDGFMIHRNTMIATDDVLYLADDESCKLIDARTGEIRREIKPPADEVGGTVWKWMALEGDVLYAMIGGEEVKTELQRGTQQGYGGWPWAMWRGYDFKDPAKAWGFGRHLMAIDVKSGEILWKHKDEDYLDGRALCLRGGRIYAYSPDKFLLCLDAKSGEQLWKSDDAAMLEAVGANGPAQGYVRGFSTTCYMKAAGDFLYFSGPQRNKLAAVSANDGKVAWTFGDGNFQIIYRDDALYAFGPQGGRSYKLEADTGKTLAEFSGRRACTRATGSIDSMFCRAFDGTIRFDPADDKIEHIAPMRPACHDGVIVSEGHLYWGPWICACNLALFGHIGLGPAGDFNFDFKPDEKQQLTLGEGDINTLVKFEGDKAPKTFLAGDDGMVVASRGEEVVWQTHTGGSVNVRPVVSGDRVFVGSNDGRVYAFEAMTGRLLWKFRAGPAVRRIPVYGQLMSTWPIAGGVAVKDDTVYAAAGIAHYDGTHVYALDAATGKIKWYNGGSGSLNEELKNGVSLAGPLSIGRSPRGEEVLQFAGGNAVQQAMFDLTTGEYRSAVPNGANGVARSVFYVEQWLKRRAAKE